MITPVIAGNWKMQRTASESEALLAELLPALGRDGNGEGQVEVLVAPSFTYLPLAAKTLAGTGIGLAAQDCHWSEEGPFTGEVSAKMLAEVGCRYVILGHSERREHFSETNRRVNAKAKAAIFWGLIPIICVGEKADERASGHAEMVVEKQLKRCLQDLSLAGGGRLMIAYEPVWAIGTGRTPTTKEIGEVHRLVRSELIDAFGKIGSRIPILYGGSVKPETVGPIVALDSVDGALVGGASLEAASFLAIVEAARRTL